MQIRTFWGRVQSGTDSVKEVLEADSRGSELHLDTSSCRHRWQRRSCQAGGGAGEHKGPSVQLLVDRCSGMCGRGRGGAEVGKGQGKTVIEGSIVGR